MIERCYWHDTLDTDPSIIGSSIEAYLSSTDLLDKVEEVEGEDQQQQSINDVTTSSTTQRYVFMRICPVQFKETS